MQRVNIEDQVNAKASVTAVWFQLTIESNYIQLGTLTIFDYHYSLVTISHFGTSDSLIFREHVSEPLSSSIVGEYYTDIWDVRERCL